jgi:hypothetical protein
MTEQNLLKLAKQGNPKAIAAMLNQSLKSKNITAKVNLKDDCLHVLVESAQLPKQQTLVSFIRKGLIQLEAESIKTVKVYGRQTGEEFPAWNETFEIVSEPETPSSSEEIDIENLSSYQILHQPPRTVPSKEETPSSPRQTDFQNSRRSSAMPKNPNPTQQMGSISVGNVVSAAVRIYRDHFKLYFGLAFSAYAWVLVPVYGWAKFSAISALISRLAYSEVIERPETVNDARRHVMPRMWSFLGAGLLVGLITFGVGVGVVVGAIFVVSVFGILAGIVGTIVGQNATAIVIFILLGIIVFIALIIGYIRLVFRLFIIEMPLAIETNVTATSTISRSLELTKGFASRLQGIVVVAFLVTIPVSIVVQIVITILQTVLTALFSTDSPIFWLLFYFFITLPLSFASGALLIPFWQAIKAVIYYDLRSRKEGLGLEIRDSR